jgi:hypothetical protein
MPGSLESVAKEATVTVAPAVITPVDTVCSAAPDPSVDNSLYVGEPIAESVETE